MGKKHSERVNRVQRLAELAVEVAQRVLPAHAHKFAPKTYTQPQLLVCLLLKEFLRQDYRGIIEVLELSDGLRRVLQLTQVPNHTTLWWFAQHKVTPDVLQQALEETVQLLEEQTKEPPSGPGKGHSKPPKQVALDSTGLFTHHTSRYFEWRTKKNRTQQSWQRCLVAGTADAHGATGASRSVWRLQ